MSNWRERGVPQSVKSAVEALPKNAFAKIREIDSAVMGATTFYDEYKNSEYYEGFDEDSIERYKKDLVSLYLPYFASKVETFIDPHNGPDFVIYDGMSALPYIYVFKAAIREYKRLHPEKEIHTPKFIFLDGHALYQERDEKVTAEQFDINRYEQQKNQFLQRLAKLDPDNSFSDIWEKGAEHTRQILDQLSAIDHPKIVVFDENSDSTNPLSQLHMLQHFLQTHLSNNPTIDISTPEDEYDKEKKMPPVGMITTWHINNPFKRVAGSKDQFRERPSRDEFPVAHKNGVAFLQECRELGKLIAHTME